jgi:hypothetical protein
MYFVVYILIDVILQLELQHLKRKGSKITMITAYDYPSAKHADYAVGIALYIGGSFAHKRFNSIYTCIPVYDIGFRRDIGRRFCGYGVSRV